MGKNMKYQVKNYVTYLSNNRYIQLHKSKRGETKSVIPAGRQRLCLQETDSRDRTSLWATVALCCRAFEHSLVTRNGQESKRRTNV